MAKLIIAVSFIFSIAFSYWMGTKSTTKTDSPKASQDAKKNNSFEGINSPVAAINPSIPVDNTIHNGKPEVKASESVNPANLIKSEELQKLKDTLSKVKKERSIANRRYDDIRSKLIEAGLVEPEYLSLEEVEKTLPAPFSSIVAEGGEYMVNLFKTLEEEDIDYDWGADMQTKLSDFIITHQFSDGISHLSVRCKTTMCEIRGFDTIEGSWNKIQKELVSEDWWQFESSSSVHSNDDKGNGFFYLLLQK
ncbi:hypothetical protein [uncultured Paraglaciecola sp.]|uniref:hypothetical protein n=1 Tax=uncultured Paraglaciecola sp. TaxID=1765024 RepID=UPI0030D90C10|tara:strand:- start:270000 stop:270749 length:750 start_codon:yes stop_codon:yes gene_type:complete